MMLPADRFYAPLTWIAVVVAGVIWLCMPLDLQPWWPVVLGILLLTGVAAVAVPAYGQRRADEQIQLDDVHEDVMHERPVILVVGPHAEAAFVRGAQTSTPRRNGDAVWLLVKTPEDLLATIAAIQEEHQRLPDAVLMPVVPDRNGDEAAIRLEFSRWRRALEVSLPYRGCMLPCYVAIYACLGPEEDEGLRRIWFGDVIDISTSTPGIESPRQRVRLMRQQLDYAWLAIGQPGRITRAALGHAVFDWLEDAALLSIVSSLANEAPFSLHGLLLADIGYTPVRAGAWTRWLTGKTGLQPPRMVPQDRPLPLPDVIPRQVTPRVVNNERRKPRTALHAMTAVAVVLAVLVGASAWTNSRMIARVASNLDAYWSTPAARTDRKHERLETLRSQYAELERYANARVPVGLGWGLYRGDALQAALRQAMSTWHPPSTSVTIDNLALFDSGKTTLKPGAVLRLREALALILANPGKRILIAGHTDDVGSSMANLKLSEARAQAVRDWFVDTASLPAARFIIQGNGDSRPIASNQSSQGRAMNRRVEISLVSNSDVH